MLEEINLLIEDRLQKIQISIGGILVLSLRLNNDYPPRQERLSINIHVKTIRRSDLLGITIPRTTLIIQSKILQSKPHQIAEN